MKYSQKIITAAAITGVIGAAGVATTAIAATNNSATNNYPPIVQKIAGTFGLDPAKVNDVFEKQHQDKMQKREAKLKNTLDQTVKDGKLTQDQADKLLAEIQTLHQQIKSSNRADRQQNRHDFRDQLDQWAAANGIADLNQILPRSDQHHIFNQR